MSIYPDLPYDPAGGHGGRRSLTQMVVIHATFNTASDENEAHYAEHRSDQVSAHFYNDGDSVIQALDTDVVAYGCFSEGNSRSVQFELTGLDWDHNPPGPTAVSDAAMREIAPVVARVCHQYGIPIRKIGPAELRAGVKGICGHADVTQAWGQGDHMDPGPAFPWAQFISYVQGGTTMGAPFAADNADAHGYALTQRLATYGVHANGSDPNLTTIGNPAAAWMKKVEDFVDHPPVATVSMSQADRDAIVAALIPAVVAALPHIPTLAEIQEAARLGANQAEDS